MLICCKGYCDCWFVTYKNNMALSLLLHNSNAHKQVYRPFPKLYRQGWRCKIFINYRYRYGSMQAKQSIQRLHKQLHPHIFLFTVQCCFQNFSSMQSLKDGMNAKCIAWEKVLYTCIWTAFESFNKAVWKCVPNNSISKHQGWFDATFISTFALIIVKCITSVSVRLSG